MFKKGEQAKTYNRSGTEDQNLTFKTETTISIKKYMSTDLEQKLLKMKHKRGKTDQNKMNRKNINELWDNFKKINVCTTKIPKEGKRNTQKKKYLQKYWLQTFQNL